MGESWRVDVDGGGLDTVTLVGTRKAWVRKGEVEMAVELTHGASHRVAIPEGWAPRLFLRTFPTPGGHGLLVEQESG